MTSRQQLLFGQLKKTRKQQSFKIKKKLQRDFKKVLKKYKKGTDTKMKTCKLKQNWGLKLWVGG